MRVQDGEDAEQFGTSVPRSHARLCVLAHMGAHSYMHKSCCMVLAEVHVPVFTPGLNNQ